MVVVMSSKNPDVAVWSSFDKKDKNGIIEDTTATSITAAVIEKITRIKEWMRCCKGRLKNSNLNRPTKVLSVFWVLLIIVIQSYKY